MSSMAGGDQLQRAVNTYKCFGIDMIRFQSILHQLPKVLIKAMNFKKGEIFEWEIVDRNTLILRRKDSKAGTKNAG